MARTDTLTNFLTDIAAAIKTKKGKETDIPAADFDTEILNLKSGGGDDGTVDGGTVAGLIDRSITSITIPNGVTKIGDYVFYNYTGLTSVTIPNSVTSIGSDAFAYCPGLTSITIPDGVTRIGGGAFQYCTGLTNMTIPDSVNSIGNSVFCYCSGLTNMTIPDSVTSIVYNMFSSCTRLTSVTILGSVTSIGIGAFYNCTSLAEIDFSTCTDIPTLESSNAFSNTSSGLVIKVPSALLDEWKAATNWATYASKIVGV